MKIFSWLKESNRMSHLWMGFSIWVILMILSVGCLLCFNSLIGITQMQTMAIALTFALLCDAAVFIAMCTVEFIQQQSGIGKWDWLDVLSGILFPFLFSVIISIVIIASVE